MGFHRKGRSGSKALHERIERGGRIHDGYAGGCVGGGGGLLRGRGVGVLLSEGERDARDEAAELQLMEDAQHIVARELAKAGVVDLETGGGRGVYGDELLAEHELLRMLSQESLDARGFHLIHLLGEGFDAAELLDELHGGFQADAGHAGDVVRGVTGERFDVALPDGVEAAVAFPDGVHVVDAGIAKTGGEEDADVGRDELERVGVSGGDEGVDGVLGGPGGDRAEDIVCLVAGDSRMGTRKALMTCLTRSMLRTSSRGIAGRVAL